MLGSEESRFCGIKTCTNSNKLTSVPHARISWLTGLIRGSRIGYKIYHTLKVQNEAPQSGRFHPQERRVQPTAAFPKRSIHIEIPFNGYRGAENELNTSCVDQIIEPTHIHINRLYNAIDSESRLREM